MGFDDELVTIDRFDSPQDAALALATLEAAGIAGALFDEHTTRLTAHGQLLGVTLKVRRADALTAMEILRTEEVPALEDAPSGESDRRYLPENRCRRCGSEEIYPVESRGRQFARAMVLCLIGFLLIQLGRCAAALADVPVPRSIEQGAFILVVVVPVVIVLILSFRARVRCRGCGAEWSGEQKTA